MIPIKREACEGRINPKGIPVLYLATDPDTAMSEIRPCMGQSISVAEFELMDDIDVVDCTENLSDESVWFYINDAFASPITNSDNKAEYAYTQIISELFKSQGFQGIYFKSSLGPGKNLVLFDIYYAKPIRSMVSETKSIKYEFHESVDICRVFNDEEGEKDEIISDNFVRFLRK